MNYPSWDVPHIGSGWVIGLIAIFHVMISHFAIGGGFYLAIAERKALREGRNDWLDILKVHSRFFMVLTAAFGTVSGVGIWFAIGLAAPEATSALIHNFVFGWAIEWTFFLIEVAAALLYYYTWGKVSNRLHLAIAWVYAGSAWLSLFVINGILTFMLTPGQGWLSVAGSSNEATMFWHAFFNPTFWPSLFLRTLICLSLAGLWALVTASRIDAYQMPHLKEEIVRWSAKWLIPAYVLLPLFFVWYLYMVPETQRGLLTLGISTIGQGVFTQVTRSALITIVTSGTIALIVYFLAYRSPRDFAFGHACSVLVIALAATGATEHTREMLRKPFVIGEYMYSNAIRVKEAEAFNRDGYLTKSPWVRDAERAGWQAALQADPGAVLPADAQAAKAAFGSLMFQGQCLACHTRDGYRSMKRLLKGRDRAAIASMIAMLHDRPEDSPYRAFMPPLVGVPAEIDALTDYLDALNRSDVSRGAPE
ncbi:MAG TPA: cytochrome ubiquinol oxidase subunit I [Candidatus Hydrogenedentes bacterium]|nr:cytochrome ubiquinol oxidase subunit I [Candidatus Hydrogenedentota bacterium]